MADERRFYRHQGGLITGSETTQGGWSCPECGALVVSESMATHDAWHARQAELATAAPLDPQTVVVQVDPELRAAVWDVVMAWTVPGPAPARHQLAQEALWNTWPTLAMALVELSKKSRPRG